MKTKEEAYAWLKKAKRNKQKMIDDMKEYLVSEYEKQHGSKPKHIEVI